MWRTVQQYEQALRARQDRSQLHSETSPMVSESARLRNPPKRCIFCGEGNKPGNPMTEEHLWSDWLEQHLPKVSDPQTRASHADFRDGQLTRKRKIQQGHPHRKRFRVVCKRCNSGWMGDIEELAKPILLPLMRGESFDLQNNEKQEL